MESMGDSRLPPKAVEMQARLKKERDWRDRKSSEGSEAFVLPIARKKEVDSGTGVLQALEASKEEESRQKEKGLLEKVWMGGEGDDWKAKRDQREKEALEEGRGYGGLIMDQIWEVWNWGKNRNQEVMEIDEKVLAARRQEKERGKES